MNEFVGKKGPFAEGLSVCTSELNSCEPITVNRECVSPVFIGRCCTIKVLQGNHWCYWDWFPWRKDELDSPVFQ